MNTPTTETEQAAANALRREARDWLAKHLTGDVRQLSREDMEDPANWEVRTAWERELASGDWVGLAWPTEHGGRGAGVLAQQAWAEEYANAHGPNRAGFFGEQLLGPTLIVHGTDAQRARFLPRILDGTEYWCQGYSEPEAGSDLAAVRTRAIHGPDGWRINGQKIWTSLAQFADYSFVLCRTDPDAPSHRGISLLLIPLNQEGVDIRPIRQLTGGREFNEMFFENVHTDKDLVVGAVDQGWRVAMSLLGFERGTAFLGMQRQFTHEFAEVVHIAKKAGLSTNPQVRDRLAEAYGGLEVLRYLGTRVVSSYASGSAPGPEASVAKLAWSQWHQRLTELGMEVSGLAGTIVDDRLTPLQYNWLFCRQDTIAAGSSEIQRNVLAERVLGLPRIA